VRRERCPSRPRSWPGWARRWADLGCAISPAARAAARRSPSISG
jgi:hypothetical protein